MVLIASPQSFALFAADPCGFGNFKWSDVLSVCVRFDCFSVVGMLHLQYSG